MKFCTKILFLFLSVLLLSSLGVFHFVLAKFTSSNSDESITSINNTSNRNDTLQDINSSDKFEKSIIAKYLPTGSYMPVSEIKPGMAGYGLSVFQGNKIEKFDIQVIGVLKKILSGRDAILAKMSGKAIANNNVIRGMSGSPVYINGKLVGAVSFGYEFSKEPIAGITPIADMLDSLIESNNKKIPLALKSQSNLTNSKTFLVPQNMSGLRNVNTVSGGLRMTPLVSPVSLCGFSAQAEKFLEGQLGELGLSVTSGSSGAMNPGLNSAAATDIKPGSAVSVLLTTGDFTSVATGTTTARFANKVVAFGHPFLTAGAVDFPMATAIVHKVLPSLAISFKITTPQTEVGAFTSDRPWSCGGSIGKQAKMIPVSFQVIDETRNLKHTYNCKIIDHPDITPQLLAATAISAIDSTHQNAGPYIAKLESVMEAEGIDPIQRKDCFASNIQARSMLSSIFNLLGGNSISRQIYRNASNITNNEFKKASIKSFKLKVTLEDGQKTANLDRVYVEKSYAAPGETVKVMCILKPFNQKPVTETLSFQIPRDTPDGNLLIGVAGGDQIDFIRHRMGLSDPEPENLKQIAEEIEKESRGDELNLVVALNEQTLLIDGVKVFDPPSHWARVFFSNKHTKGPQIIKGEILSKKLSDWLLSGSHILTVEVRNPDKVLARSSPASMPSYIGGEDPAITEAARKALNSSTIGKDRSNAGRLGQAITLIQNMGGTNNSNNNSQNSSSTNSTNKTNTSGNSIFASAGKLYPHMRLHQIWRQETEEDFQAGKCEGTTVDSWGRIGPGLDNTLNKFINPESTVWSSLYLDSWLYYSTNNEIWRWHIDEREPELFLSLDTTLISSIATDNNGTIYAAAVPSGGVYAIKQTSSGISKKLIFKPAEPVITSLCVDEKNNLYVGVAGKGKVYKITNDQNDQNDQSNQKVQMIFDSEQAHITSMFYAKDEHKLYIGTAEKGAVFCIDEDGKTSSIYQSPDHIITGIAKTKSGDIYIASANQGKLVRLLASGEIQSLASSETFYTLHYNQETDTVYSGDAEGDITMAVVDQITEQPYFIPVCHTDQEAVLTLSSSSTQLFAASTNLAYLKVFNLTNAKAPRYFSKVKDASRIANWTRVRLAGAFTESNKDLISNMIVETRSGNTSNPDSTWSPWSQASFDGESFKIKSPDARFLQFSLTWNHTNNINDSNNINPALIGRVDVVYLPKDVAPQFSSNSIKAASALSGKQTISITGSDADGDNMLCSIDISNDKGKTWENLVKDLRPKSAKKESTTVTNANKESNKETNPKDKVNEKLDKDKEAKKDDQTNLTNKNKVETKSHRNQKTDKNKSENKRKDTNILSNLFNFVSILPLDDKESKEPDKGNSDKKNDQDEDKDKSEQPDHKSDNNKDSQDKDSNKDNSDNKDSKDSDKTSEKSTKKEDEEKDKDDKKSSKSKSSTDTQSSTNKASEGASTESFTWSWDTTKQKDANYILKFTLDDSLSSPEDNRKTMNLRAVTVDNTAPEISHLECIINTNKKQENHKTVTCKLVVRDNLSPIVNATYRFDEGESFAFSSSESSGDGLSSSLEAVDILCPNNAHKIEVKVSDRAGNTASKSANIK